MCIVKSAQVLYRATFSWEHSRRCIVFLPQFSRLSRHVRYAQGCALIGLRATSYIVPYFYPSLFDFFFLPFRYNAKSCLLHARRFPGSCWFVEVDIITSLIANQVVELWGALENKSYFIWCFITSEFAEI